MRSHTYLSDVALADIAFVATGETPQELFEASAQAVMGAMADLDRVKPRTRKKVSLHHQDLDQLLFDWLSELIYLKDAESILFSQFAVVLTQKGHWKLEGIASGEPIDPHRHSLLVDVKAVTYHLFEISHCDGLWTARVVLDI